MKKYRGSLEQVTSCAGDYKRHKFEATYEVEGGLRENPGVWKYDGARVIIFTHCTREGCNVTRYEDHDPLRTPKSEVIYGERDEPREEKITEQKIPSCAGDNASHKFEATYEVEDGLENNPGVWGNHGGQ